MQRWKKAKNQKAAEEEALKENYQEATSNQSNIFVIFLYLNIFVLFGLAYIHMCVFQAPTS